MLWIRQNYPGPDFDCSAAVFYVVSICSECKSDKKHAPQANKSSARRFGPGRGGPGRRPGRVDHPGRVDPGRRAQEQRPGHIPAPDRGGHGEAGDPGARPSPAARERHVQRVRPGRAQDQEPGADDPVGQVQEEVQELVEELGALQEEEGVSKVEGGEEVGGNKKKFRIS